MWYILIHAYLLHGSCYKKRSVLSFCYNSFILIIFLWVTLFPIGYNCTVKWLTFRDQLLALILSGINWRTSQCLGSVPGRTDLSWKVGRICLILCKTGCSLTDAWQGVKCLNSIPGSLVCRHCQRKHYTTSGKRRRGQGSSARQDFFHSSFPVNYSGKHFIKLYLLDQSLDTMILFDI